MKCFAVNYNTNVEVIVMSLNSQPYAENGVFISNSSLSVGEEVAITYEGLLAKSGADQMFLHIGYGEEWLDKTFIPMERENGVFKGTFKIALPDDLNISFKDSANNWDNNSSMNYSFKITGKTKAAKKSTSKAAKKDSDAETKAQSKEAKKSTKASDEKKSSAKSKSQSTDEVKEKKAASTAKKSTKSTTKASTKSTSKSSKEN